MINLSAKKKKKKKGYVVVNYKFDNNSLDKSSSWCWFLNINYCKYKFHM